LKVLRLRSGDDADAERIADLAIQHPKFTPTPAEGSLLMIEVSLTHKR
jgi:hypothetical protein